MRVPTFGSRGSQIAAPSTKSALRALQSAAPAMKSVLRGSQICAELCTTGLQSTAPAKTSAPGSSQLAVAATKSSQCAAPATKSAHARLQSAAPTITCAHQDSHRAALPLRFVSQDKFETEGPNRSFGAIPLHFYESDPHVQSSRFTTIHCTCHEIRARQRPHQVQSAAPAGHETAHRSKTAPISRTCQEKSTSDHQSTRILAPARQSQNYAWHHNASAVEESTSSSHCASKISRGMNVW